MKAIKAILWYIAGFILVPVILAFTPKDMRETKHTTSIRIRNRARLNWLLNGI